MPTEIDYVVLKADWLEIIWVSITFIALIANVFLFDAAMRNSIAIRVLQVNGPRRYAARTQIIREIIRIVKQLALLSVGLRAATIPNYEHIERTWDFYFIVVMLMLVAVGMALAAVVDFYRFRMLLQMVEASDFYSRMQDYGYRDQRRDAP